MLKVQRLHLSSRAATHIKALIQEQSTGPYHSWTEVPPDVRDMWCEEFQVTKGTGIGMTQVTQGTMELLQGPVTRAMARRMEKEHQGKIYLSCQVLLEIDYSIPPSVDIISNVARLLWLFEGTELRTNPFKGGADGMTWVAKGTVELLQGPTTRAMARRMEKEYRGKIAIFKGMMRDLI
ncbi:hypothetical protein M9H77_17324 [Catharanthus roseus]|uniref:Uncharacterized protein n=1 Tax=Catharanthus roseus TaxID=4058 RepID=A0ACC0B490_CATRO|nr:hypothetical protein M9H77_17324 [Catharanthus roseus]